MGGLIQSGQLVLKISVGDSSALGVKYLSIKNGISADMATLNIGATDIVAAIRDSSLQFGAFGLKLTNGDFAIYDTNYKLAEELTEEAFNQGENKYYILDANDQYILAKEYESGQNYFIKEEAPVFYTDDNGNLNLVGKITAKDGYFEGEVKATSGEFTGTIIANDGSIGGFTADSEKLWSADESIILYGKEGRVVAKNIELGDGAQVTDKIVFHSGDGTPTFTLYNPVLHRLDLPSGIDVGGKVLSAANTILTNKGYLRLGSLEMFGGTGQLDGYIRSSTSDSNSQTQDGWWRINENGSSYFDTIYVDNAHIRNTVMEQKTIQSVGSTMIFKETWTISSGPLSLAVNSSASEDGEEIMETEAEWYKLDGLANLIQNDYVFIENKVYKIKDVRNVEIEEAKYEEVPITEDKFNPDVHYILANDEYSQARKYEPGQTYYELSEEAGLYTYISLVDNSQRNPLKGSIVTKLGAAGTQVYTKAAETERLPGRRYFTKSEDAYTEYEGELQQNVEYYYIKTEASSDCIISIQGGMSEQDSAVGQLAVPQSLSFSSFYDAGGEGNPKLEYTKHLILGKLSNSGIDELNNYQGYGLYADQVFLNGAITTKATDGAYSGINTLNPVTFNKWEKDNSEIIIWGGAKDKSDSSIQEAPFQVTKNGTVYTNNAIIENSVFAGGEISAATIKTAKIYGQEENNPSLTIYDAKIGIAFMSTNNTPEEGDSTVLAIGSDGLLRAAATGGESGVEYENFLNPNLAYPTFYGVMESKGPSYKINYITSGIAFDKINEDSAEGSSTPIGKIKPYYDISNNTNQLLVSVGNYDNQNHSDGVVSFQADRVVTTVDQYFDDNMICGRGSNGMYAMEFKKKTAGYDIIIN